MKTKPKSFNQVSSEFEIYRIVIRELWKLDNDGMKTLAASANVGVSTMGHWKYGKTLSPRIDTLTKVLYALGYTIKAQKITNKSQKPKLRRVK